MAGIRVLLIEDDEIDAERTMRMFERLMTPTTVTRVATLGSALGVLEQEGPSVVFLDLHLPDATNLEGPRLLTSRYRSIPLVVLTGLEDHDAALQALELGAQDYLNKNALNPDVLERTMRYAVVRHRAHSRLTETSLQLQRSAEEFEDFARTVAHDLRSPVRTARLLADRMIASVDGEAADPHDLGGRLDSTLCRLDEVILSMLDYTGMRSAPAATTSVRLGEVVRDVVTALEADIDDAVIDIEIPDNLMVVAESILLWRVIENLITNSIKYRDRGRDLEIWVEGKADGDRVAISVRDNGVGIPSEDRERVFRMLERLQAEGPGQGLGLSVCRQIMNSLDGSIWIEPDATNGTTVKIDLPRAWS